MQKTVGVSPHRVILIPIWRNYKQIYIIMRNTSNITKTCLLISNLDVQLQVVVVVHHWEPVRMLKGSYRQALYTVWLFPWSLGNVGPDSQTFQYLGLDIVLHWKDSTTKCVTCQTCCHCNLRHADNDLDDLLTSWNPNLNKMWKFSTRW